MDDLTKFDENTAISKSQLRTYPYNPAQKRGSMMNIEYNQTKKIQDEINDGVKVPLKDSIVSQSCHTINEKGFSLKGRIRSSTMRINYS